ncbi:MAG: hypothetical protein JXD23_01220 [Spirochaetales bacterium]|nr:hypothetical protein [Spirochaetales bacterium]
MKTLRTMLIAAALMFTAAVAMNALDVTQGDVKLVLYEKGGRFNVFFTKPGTPAQSFAFFAKEDPRTTMLQILVDNDIYTMGDDASFRQTAEKTAGGARFVWSSALMRVTEEFTLLTQSDVPLSQGVKIVIKIDNVSEVDHRIGVRYLFDTFLGEKKGTHFVTSANNTFAREAALNVGRSDFYWISPYIESGSGEGVMSLAASQYATAPAEVVFANWKRLYEANWDYKSPGNLDFNFFPYSFNDSAVAQYYPIQELKKKTSREIVIVLGNAASYDTSRAPLVAKNNDLSSDKNKLLDGSDRPTLETGPEIAKTETQTKNVPALVRFTGSITKPLTKTNFDFVYAEIGRLDQFINAIDAKIQAGKPLTDEELKQYRSTLSDIETKASRKE